VNCLLGLVRLNAGDVAARLDAAAPYFVISAAVSQIVRGISVQDDEIGQLTSREHATVVQPEHKAVASGVISTAARPT